MIYRRSGYWRFLLVNVVLWCALAANSQSLAVPFLAGRVNDMAHMLLSKTINALEALLNAHEDSTSNQVVVLTIPSLQGEPLEEYSIKVVETWKLGQKDKDNGVLLLIVRDDRKVRIEVGNGLEGDLPDITCGHIIRNEIVPRFRNSDYEGGIRAGVSAILGAINGSYKAEESSAVAAPDFLFCGPSAPQPEGQACGVGELRVDPAAVDGRLAMDHPTTSPAVAAVFPAAVRRVVGKR